MEHSIGLRTRPLVRVEQFGFLGRQRRESIVSPYRWTIDGQDLVEWVQDRRGAQDPTGPVEQTVWLASDVDDARDRVARLLGEAAPEFGSRTALLMCPECGDRWCGAFTAEIVVEVESVEWRNLGYDGHERDTPPLLFDPSLRLRFNRSQYVEALRGALREVERNA